MSSATLFGQILYEYRTEEGLSLRKLAEKVGVSHAFLVEIEHGRKSALADKHLPALVAALNFEYPDYWLERWRRIAVISRLEFSGVLDELPDEEKRQIKWYILDRWTDQQVASGRFNEE